MLAVVVLSAAACSSSSDSGTNTTTGPVAATIALTPASTASFVSVGETRSISALVKDAAGVALANPTVTYSSSNAGVASVSGSGTTATVTAVSDGSVTITATSGAASATVSFTVAQKFAALAVTPASPSIGIGGAVSLQASARDAKGNTIAGATGVTFTTAAASTAIVSSTGAVTGIAPGTTVITASLTRDGTTATATAAVTVTPPASAALTAAVGTTDAAFTVPTVNVAVGGTVTWTFGAIPHNVNFSSANAPTNIGTSSATTVSRTFATAGTYPYSCNIHAGMNGTVVVAPPSFMALLNGPNERPTPTTSTGTGAAAITLNGTTVNYTVAYQGITGAPTGLHIHSPGGINAAAGISVDLLTTPQTTTAGVLTGTFNSANIRTAGVSLDSLLTLLRNGNAYVNIHSSTFPGGEIRGQVGAP
jgi:plastocyanin